MPASENALSPLRDRIDAIDAQLLQMLNERASIVAEVGRVKRASGIPVYAPHRERQVIERVLARNEGPLEDRTIEAIWRELMSGSFRLELPLRVGYLGPRGSFSHMAAVRHFGSSVDFEDFRSIDDVFREISAGRLDYGLVPYENSIGGGITDTLDAFLSGGVMICAESLIDVTQCFLTNGDPALVRRIYSKPQAFEQCRRWLSARYPGVERVPTISTSEAVQIAAREEAAAAIGSDLAGSIYGVNVTHRHIEDASTNVTRFLVIASRPARPTGDDKTVIMFVTAHRPGALVDVLADFRDRGVNLSHIEKRPSGRTNWEYTFFIDADGHHEDEPLAQAIQAAQRHCVMLRVLGSFPKAGAVLGS